MKIIIIGTSLSGKTTIINSLRASTDLPISEMDEELTKINNGQFPTNPKYKHEVLSPKIINKIIHLDNIVFFTNTDYFSKQELKEARGKGFKIIQLEVGLDELTKRNLKRIKEEGYDDLSQWLGGMLEYQKEIKKERMVDDIIDASQPIDKVNSDLLKSFQNKLKRGK